MKRILASGVAVLALSACSAEYFVATDGNDVADGTRTAPFATVARGISAARGTPGPNVVTLLPGVHTLERTLELDARDSGLVLRADKPGTAVLTGGRRITDWKRDGNSFWCADLPEVKAGTWNFRALSVNGVLAPRACFPGGTNRFENLGDWSLPLLPALAGHWERKPTRAELVTMPYKASDLPDSLDFKSAELRLYHMWNETLSGVASNDLQRHIVYLSVPAAWPMGACGRRQYEVYNVREGMTAPGQWYLDRTRGKLVYWPKSGETPAKLVVEAPRLERLLVAKGDRKKRVDGLRLEGLVFQSTTPPMQGAGFGGGDMAGAIEMSFTTNCVLANVEVRAVGGSGVKMSSSARFRVSRCDVHDVGCRGVGVSGSDGVVEDTRICHVGRIYPCASVMGAYGDRIAIRRCELFDGPYSGIIGGGTDMLYEDNRIHRVMRVLHDGAAIYGNMVRGVMRGNVVHDIVPNGKGFGASAFYYDEGAVDCIIERNVAYGVARPVHNHITRNTQVRDNVFLSDGDMRISFQNSIGCAFARNTCVVRGKFEVSCPEAVPTWQDNRVFKSVGRDGERTEIGNAEPARLPLARQYALPAPRTDKAPVPDGEFAGGEWPGKWTTLGRDANRLFIGGATAFVRAAWDDRFLHVGVLATNFRTATFSDGAQWGVDDGIELLIAGKTFRAFLCGKTETEIPGVSAYAGRKKGWKPWDWAKPNIYEVSIPFTALGIEPKTGTQIPFNARVHNHEYGEERWFEAPCPFPDGTAPAPKLILK